MTIAPSPEMIALAKRLIAQAHDDDKARLRNPAEFERAVIRLFGFIRGDELLRAGDAAILGAVESRLNDQRHFATRRQTRHSWAEHLTCVGLAEVARERIAARAGVAVAAE